MKTVLTNAKIYTEDKDKLIASTLVYDMEKILYVGKGGPDIWGEIAGPDAQVYDLAGKTIIPGIIDSHTHPGMVSQSSWHIRLPWTEDANEVLAFIKEYAEAHPVEEAPFLYFEYYPTSMFDLEGPTKELLDPIVSDRPCLVQDFGEHLCWVNSKMLEMMEVDKDTEDPVPGLQMFVRDGDGNPTGWVKELAWLHFADKMYEKIGWKPPITLTPELMEGFFDFMTDHGVTGIVDGLVEGESQLKSMKALYGAGKIKHYYDGCVRFFDYRDLAEKIEELKKYRDTYSSKHMKFNTMKLFLDGTNESGNCAVVEPFSNDPDHKNLGEIAMETEELKDCLLLINSEGFDLHIHVVGDRAFRTACDAYEEAKAEVESQGLEWRTQMILAHCELVHPEDVNRPAELGITVNWSCHWSGGYFGDEAKNYLGEKRWNSMYNFNPMIESGALVTFSSDVVTGYELNRANPFFGMQVAATRIDPQVPLDPDIYPNSMRPSGGAKLSVEDMLTGYTISGARQMAWDDKLGSLEEGKLANMVILSKDLMEVEPEKLSTIQAEVVIFEGETVKGDLK